MRMLDSFGWILLYETASRRNFESLQIDGSGPKGGLSIGSFKVDATDEGGTRTKL